MEVTTLSSKTFSKNTEVVSKIIIGILDIQVSYTNFVRKHKTQIRLLKIEFKALTFAFDRHLETMMNDYIGASFELANIISELRIASASGSFDLINLSEIQGSCEKLIALRESDHQHVQNMEDEISILRKSIRKEKKVISKMALEKSSGVSVARCTTEASEALTTFLNYGSSNHEVVFKATTLLVIVGAIIRFINYCTLHGFMELITDLKQLQDKVVSLTMHVETLEETTTDLIHYQLENYLQSTKKGIMYHSFSGERTREQAQKMIRETEELQRDYLQIREQAKQTRLYLKKYLV